VATCPCPGGRRQATV